MNGAVHLYSIKDLERVLGIPAAAVKSLLRGGHIKPSTGGGGARGYTFQDLILIRTAGALRDAGLSVQKINGALRDLRAALPDEVPLSGLSITASGNRVAVREGSQQRDVRTGQYLLALEVRSTPGSVRMIERPVRNRRAADRRTAELADEHFKDGYVSETDDPDRAVQAYQRCLSLDPNHREARINLGRLLHLSGSLTEAECVYRASPREDCDIFFNLGVVLEDLHRSTEAIEVYSRAVALDPSCADAHYNLARLHDAEGRSSDSLRHLIAYKRLT